MQDGKKVWNENVSLLISANRIWRDQLGREDWGGVFDIKTCKSLSNQMYFRATDVILIGSDDLKLVSEKKQRWVNLIAFTAQLSQAAPPWPKYDDNPLNWAHMALWSLRAAFEADISPHEVVGTTTFQAACFWFIYAANAVWACVEKEIEAGGSYVSSPGSQYKHRDWKGFNRERWNIWVHALEHAQIRCHDSNTETMHMIVDALHKAKTAEKGN